LGIGAVVPSGRLLAKLMVKNLRPGARVVELGAGTGTVTEAILESGVRARDLFVVEQNEAFIGILRRRFHGVAVVHGDALSLQADLGYLAGTVDGVISSLPLLLFSQPDRRRALAESFALLKGDGFMHQFTYGGRCPVARSMRKELGLRASLVGVAAVNLPPAFVYRLERIAP
jgi:phospholipid N-methyltransferase